MTDPPFVETVCLLEPLSSTKNVVKPSTTTRICRPRWGYPTGISSKIFGIRKLVPGLSRDVL